MKDKTLLEQVHNPQVLEAVHQLARAGITGVFFTIRRRRAGEQLWVYWKRNIPADRVEDIEELCYKDGGDDWEYKVVAHDQRRMPVKDEKGKIVDAAFLPALRKPSPEEIAAEAGVKAMGAVTSDLDPDLLEETKQLARQRVVNSLKRQRIELDRENERLARMDQGQFESEDENDDGYGPPPAMSGRRGRRERGGPPPWYFDPRFAPRQDDSKEFLFAMMENQTRLLTAMIENRNSPDRSGREDALLMYLLQNQTKPKEMLDLAQGMMGRSAEIQAQGMRQVMENALEMNASIIGKMVDFAMETGRPDDEIDKIKRIAEVVTGGGKELVKMAFGRDSIARPDQEVRVPKIEAGARPALPAKVPEGANGVQANPARKQISRSAGKTAADRVRVFLKVEREEMNVPSDPGAVAEVLFRRSYAFLPESIRDIVEEEKIDFERLHLELKKFAPEEADGILDEVSQDKSEKKRQWVEAFWGFIGEMSEGEEEDGNDPEGGSSDSAPAKA